MSEKLLSVGIDVGTTSTQIIFSELTVENRAGSFSVPEMDISERKIRYKSPVHFTPLVRGELVDGDRLRQIVDAEYEKAGVSKSDVDTGAVIITGETSRKENARAVLEVLSGYAGDTNKKLRRRMIGIVTEILGCSETEAERLLDENGWNIRNAVENN